MSVTVTVKNVSTDSAIKQVIETVQAEIVSVAKFLEAYPSLARFPTRFEHNNVSELQAPGICYIADHKRNFESQCLQSWFVNFAEDSINGVKMPVERKTELLNDCLRAFALERPMSFRADPSDEDFHLATLPVQKACVHLFVCSSPANGELLKMTIIKKSPISE